MPTIPMRTLADDLAAAVSAAADPPSILQEAHEIIYGDREQTHGAPQKNLEAIARIWSALLSSHLGVDCVIPPALVCLMMAGLKLARAANKPSHRDHARDTAGYMGLMDRCGYLDAED